MRAQPNRLVDKRFLWEVAETIKCSKTKIKLDECGDWNIFGKQGHLSTDGSDNLYLYYLGTSAKKWNNVKKLLNFMEVTQDGDEEGFLKLDRLPSAEEGNIIRRTLKLRMSTDQSQNLTSKSPVAEAIK